MRMSQHWENHDDKGAADLPEPILDDATEEERIYLYTLNAGRREPQFLAFRTLQLANIFRLQHDLARIKHRVASARAATKQDTERLPGLLHSYSEE